MIPPATSRRSCRLVVAAASISDSTVMWPSRRSSGWSAPATTTSSRSDETPSRRGRSAAGDQPGVRAPGGGARASTSSPKRPMCWSRSRCRRRRRRSMWRTQKPRRGHRHGRSWRSMPRTRWRCREWNGWEEPMPDRRSRMTGSRNGPLAPGSWHGPDRWPGLAARPRGRALRLGSAHGPQPALGRLTGLRPTGAAAQQAHREHRSLP